MRSKLIILGCGSSIGVPRIDGYWGNCKKMRRKITELDAALLLLGVLIRY